MNVRRTTTTPSKPAPALKTEADMSRRLFLLLGLLIFIAAVVIRGIRLDRPSYWIDEINILRDAMNPPTIADILRIELARFQSYRGVPFPLFILRIFLKLLGFPGPYPGALPPEWAPRLPSMLAGLTAIPILGALARDVAGRKTGLWAMFLCTFSVFHVWYCRDVRVYGLITMLLAGTLWTGQRMVREPAPSKKWWAWAFAYMAFAGAYLQSTLNTIFVLLPWSGIILIAAILRQGGRVWFSSVTRVLAWLLALGMPFLLFAPFLVRLFGYSIEGQIADTSVIVSWSILPAVLGRMGFGEAWFVLLPFVGLLLLGAAGSLIAWKQHKQETGLLLLLQGLAVLALQSAAQWLSNSGFEVRYYIGMFPVLIVLAAFGLEKFTAQMLGRYLGKPWVARVAASVLILAWALPNIWLVVNLRCQGFCNYKAIAEWINGHVPKTGVYSFYNIYEVRGVPMTYQTPDRIPTSVAVWSLADEYRRVQPALRAVEFFRMFPEIPFIEIGPTDLLRPDKADAFIPREILFMRKEWIDDPAFEKLVKWQTCPLGGVQFYNETCNHILISWNQPEDLPVLAQKTGRKFYHKWGPEWHYGRDQQARHWMTLAAKGSLILGNVSGMDQVATMALEVVAQHACRLNVTAAGEMDKEARVFDLQANTLMNVNFKNLPLKPGENTIILHATSMENHVSQPALYVKGIKLE